MPHLVIYYTPNLEPAANIGGLCRALADLLLAARDEQDLPVFPPGGIRVLAFPAAHFALADGGQVARARGLSDDYAFVYLNLRIGTGRSRRVQEQVGTTLLQAARAHLAQEFARRPLGLTLQIDAGNEVYDGRHSTLHPLFKPET